MFETEASRERWTVRAALIALGISAISVIFTFMQWKAAERAVFVADQARKDASYEAELQRQDAQRALEQQKKDAADALGVQIKRADQANVVADRSAKAAEASSRTASEALSVSERAYVGIGSIGTYCLVCEHPSDIHPPLKFPPEANAMFLVNIVNYGKTPAYLLEINATRHTELGGHLPQDFDFAEDASADSTIGLLAPDPSTPLQLRLPERAEQILEARRQIPVQRPEGQTAEAYLYIYGHVSYTDIFHHRRTVLYCREFTGPTEAVPEHWTRCFMHEGEVETFKPKKIAHAPGFALPRFYPPEPDIRPPQLGQPHP